jgi:hypothetical protein
MAKATLHARRALLLTALAFGTGCVESTTIGSASTDPAVPLSVTLQDFYTPDGTSTTTHGQCLGFTAVAHGFTFPAHATISMGPMGSVPVVLKDSTHLRVGSKQTKRTCVFTPIFGAAADWDVTVTVPGTSTFSFPAAIHAGAAVIHEVGAVGKTRVWTRDFLQDPGANAFERPYDVDLYQVEFSDVYHAFGHIDFFPLGGASIVPSVEYWNALWPNSPLGRGGSGDIFPEPGKNVIAVKDVQGKGGPGVNYDVSMRGDEVLSTAEGHSCADAPPITPGSYHVEDAGLTNNLDPQGNTGCFDTAYQSPLNASGPDTAWTVSVPAHQELRVSAYDDQYHSVLYLLPIANGCSAIPTNCVAAAGAFGTGNTNVVVYDNTTNASQSFFVVHDSAAPVQGSDGSFLFSVELFDRN